MNGVLPVDKPAGPTSHDVVAMARRGLGVRRIGHTGTLDPFATGLLLLCVGPATRLAEYLTGMEKAYEAVARLGVRTDSLDSTGTVLGANEEWQRLSPDEIRAAFECEVGTRPQQPPAFSAKKIAGRRAYDLAREGKAVLPAPVDVTIRALEVSRIDGASVHFTMTCSSGTYVRAVARDAGDRLGVGAHLTKLRRTLVGGFLVEDAIRVDQLEDTSAVNAALISPLDALGHLPAIPLDQSEAHRVSNGQGVERPARDPQNDLADGGRDAGGLVALSFEGELLAVAERSGHQLRPRKVFT